jgi:Fe-S-cluster containining protein
VFLSEKDVSMFGIALNIGYGEFTGTYCRWIPSLNRTYRLSLKEKTNYDCIFCSPDGDCSVYETRPLQCRAFPFWSSVLKNKQSWEETARDCPGMDQGTLHSPDSIKKWLALRQNEPIISKGES